MTAINWTTIKDVIHAWVVSATGLTATRVLFGGQNAIRPPGVTDAWISIWIPVSEDHYFGWVEYLDNPSPTPGQELIKRTHGTAEITGQVTCFGPKGATDTTEACVYTSELLASSNVEEVTTPLWNAGVGLQQMSPATNVGGTINVTRIEPRSQFTFTFHTATVVDRFITFIEHVNFEVELTTESGVKDFDFAVDLG